MQFCVDDSGLFLRTANCRLSKPSCNAASKSSGVSSFGNTNRFVTDHRPSDRSMRAIFVAALPMSIPNTLALRFELLLRFAFAVFLEERFIAVP